MRGGLGIGHDQSPCRVENKPDILRVAWGTAERSLTVEKRRVHFFSRENLSGRKPLRLAGRSRRCREWGVPFQTRNSRLPPEGRLKAFSASFVRLSSGREDEAAGKSGYGHGHSSLLCLSQNAGVRNTPAARRFREEARTAEEPLTRGLPSPRTRYPCSGAGGLCRPPRDQRIR